MERSPGICRGFTRRGTIIATPYRRSAHESCPLKIVPHADVRHGAVACFADPVSRSIRSYSGAQTMPMCIFQRLAFRGAHGVVLLLIAGIHAPRAADAVAVRHTVCWASQRPQSAHRHRRTSCVAADASAGLRDLRRTVHLHARNDGHADADPEGADRLRRLRRKIDWTFLGLSMPAWSLGVVPAAGRGRIVRRAAHTPLSGCLRCDAGQQTAMMAARRRNTSMSSSNERSLHP